MNKRQNKKLKLKLKNYFKSNIKLKQLYAPCEINTNAMLFFLATGTFFNI
jgi:hypothetical protein